MIYLPEPKPALIFRLYAARHIFPGRASYGFLTVPLVAEGLDLIGEFGQILVGTAFVVADNCEQALSRCQQTGIDAGRLLRPRLLLPLNAVALGHPQPLAGC